MSWIRVSYTTRIYTLEPVSNLHTDTVHGRIKGRIMRTRR